MIVWSTLLLTDGVSQQVDLTSLCWWRLQIFHNILEHSIQWPAVPEEMSEAAQDLITRLLSQDPTQRLGFDGAQGVKEHPFFAGVDWAALPHQVRLRLAHTWVSLANQNAPPNSERAIKSSP